MSKYVYHYHASEYRGACPVEHFGGIVVRESPIASDADFGQLREHAAKSACVELRRVQILGLTFLHKLPGDAKNMQEMFDDAFEGVQP